MRAKDNIEKFLKSRLDNLDYDFQDDWAVFEQKLEQALYIRHIRRMMWMGLSIVFLIGLFVGMNVYEYYDREYIPRSQQDINMEAYSTSSPAILIGKKDEPETGMVVRGKGSQILTGRFKNPEVGDMQNSRNMNVASASPVSSVVHNSESEYTSRNNPVTPINNHSSVPGSVKENTDPEEKNDGIDEEKVSELSLDSKVPELSRKELGFLVDEDIPMKGVNVNSSFEGQWPEDLYTGNLSDYTDMSLRFPIEVKEVKKEDTGPYVSPLQEINPWSYSINVYPNFAFRKMTVDEEKTDLLHRDFIDAVQAAESGSFSLNIGLRISRRIGAITFINSGVEYITYKNEVVYNFRNFRDAHINQQTGSIEKYTLKKESELISFSDINTYNYLNFPLSISYQPWASDHIRLNIEAGGSYLHFMSAHGQTLNYKTLETIDLSSREFKRSMASFSFKVGANYYVSDKINVGFEPTIMYFTNSIYSEDYPFYVIPYSVGLNLKLQVKLN